ncbi:MAG: UDP-N-acetylmuramoyl-L-alanine--D-glutamate ligase [Desulfotignum sp.]
MHLPRTSYILICGLGRSGLSTARFLAAEGYQIKATDKDAARKVHEPELHHLGIDTQIGYHDTETFVRAGAIVVSPGIPLTMPYLMQAKAAGVPLVGDLDIFTFYNKTPVVAITGTNGKTTVTTLIRDMLEASGISTFMGGNIGIPLVDCLMTGSTTQVVVAEISSFQLDLARHFKPEIAVLLNISPDHLDRYVGMDDYCRSKWSIFKNQTSVHTAIVNANLIGDCQIPFRPASRVLEFSADPDARIHQGARIIDQTIFLNLPESPAGHSTSIDCQTLVRIPGIHNLENIAAAALAALCAGGNVTGIIQAVRTFDGLPHRLTFVAEIDGIQFYNDSKATNTDAVIRALNCFTKPVVLILGGREKDTDFTLLRPALEPVRQIIAMGEAADHIHDLFSQNFRLKRVPDMKTAVTQAHAAAQPGDIVLLSPACASFDMFENYAARGDAFTRHVRELEMRHHG